MNGERCLFCDSRDVGRWVLKGTALPVCERCTAGNRGRYVEPVEGRRGKVRGSK